MSPWLNPYPPHYRAAFAFSLLFYPLSYRDLLRGLYPKGRQRVYHVPQVYRDGLGRASSPVARQLRRESSEFPNLATYLLVPACQPLWLVIN